MANNDDEHSERHIKLSDLMNEAFQEEVDNRRLLHDCEGPHDFVPGARRWRGMSSEQEHICTRCKGTVMSNEAYWYKRGLAHSSKIP